MLRLLKEGYGLLRCHKKAVMFFYIGNLSVAGLVALPFMKVFERSLGSGFYREKLVESLDYDWLTLFQDRVTGFASTFSPAVMGVGPFVRNLQALLDGKLSDFPVTLLALGGTYVVLNSFLLSASLASFTLDPKGATIREFFRNGGGFFGRMIRLTILVFLTFWFLNAWVGEPLGALIRYISADALQETSVFYWQNARFVLLLLLFLFVNMVFDYARIKTIVEDRTSIILAFLSALTFCITYARPALAFYLLITGLGLFWMVVYSVGESLMHQQHWLAILVVVLWQQLYMVGRLSVKLLFYTSQLHFYLDR